MPIKKLLPILLFILVIVAGFLWWRKDLLNSAFDVIQPSTTADISDWQLYNHPLFYFSYPTDWNSSKQVQVGRTSEIRFYKKLEIRLIFEIYDNGPATETKSGIQYTNLDELLNKTGQATLAEELFVNGYRVKYIPRSSTRFIEKMITITPDDSLIITLIYFPESEADDTFRKIMDSFRFMDPEAG